MTLNLRVTPQRMESLRMLIRWVQHEGGLDSPGKINLDTVSEKLSVTRDQLNRFLANIGTEDDLKKRHRELAANLYPFIEKRGALTPSPRRLAEDVYGDETLGMVRGVIENPRVIGHKALTVPEPNAREQIKPLEGLNVIVRMANEYVGDESDEEQGVTRGWSVSVLNVPPRGVQEGDHHPLFKLRQVGTSNHPLTIEGVVVPRGDRLVLQGIEVQEQKAFSATVALSHDKWIAYRPEQDKLRTEAIASSGVMLGLSSSKMPFVALFEIFAESI